MTGLEMGLLARRLAANGFVTRRFFYPSLRNSPAENARRLNRYLQRLEAERIHLVAHSLGGILLLHLFDKYTNLPEGRVVLMGSPVLGSGVAQRLDAIPGLRLLLGRSGVSGLLGDAPVWRGQRDLGVIAGARGVGVGTMVGGLSNPNDGTVAVAETKVAQVTDSCVINTSHMGMVFSTRVAAEVSSFLRTGRFSGSSAVLERK